MPATLSFTLTRKVRVSAWRAAVPVAFGESRPELLSVVQLAADFGTVGAALVRDELFATLPEMISRRVLETGAALRLLERDEAGYRATAEGKRALAARSVLVPQLGTWTIWLTDDVLVPPEHRLLRVDPYVEDRRERSERRDDETRAERLPAWAIEALAAPTVLHFTKGTPLARVEVADGVRCQPVSTKHELRLGLNVALGDTEAPLEVELHGSIEPDSCAPQHQQTAQRGRFSFRHDIARASDVWGACLGDRLAQWDGTTLGVAFADIAAETRASRRTRMTTRPVQHPVVGGFAPVEVDRVPVRPATRADANAWAAWTLERRINGYVWPEDWARLTDEVAREFAPYSISFPGRRELARGARGQADTASPVFWHLMAPMDLALEDA